MNGSSVPKNWEQKSTCNNSDANTMYGTRCVTHHDRDTLIWGGGQLIFTVSLDKKNVFTLHNAPGYTTFTVYGSTIGDDQYLYDYKNDFIPDNLAVFSHSAVTHT